ncbi:hypothetical protein [Ancylobacter sp.]|uniref:hypothetical protein n=1 Tax=Ancylobacter sp. TaxID=1872567 RepID=UPI003D0E5DF0
MTDGYLCGWRLSSELPLPELMAWTGDDRPADLTIRIGDVPEQLPGGQEASALLQVDGMGSVLLAVPHVGRYLVHPGGEIVISPSPQASPAEIRLFLLGTVLGVVCHQRGVLPLHGSCVAMHGGAVALCGRSGMGKSTLALHFGRRGFAVLADDVCVVESAEAPLVRPSFPRLKLWRDTMEAAALSPEGLERNRRGQEKYHYLAHQAGSREPMPLRAVVLLRAPVAGDDEGIRRLSKPLDIITALESDTFRPRVARQLGRDALLFRTRVQIANRVPVHVLTRELNGPPDRWLDAIEAAVRG